MTALQHLGASAPVAGGTAGAHYLYDFAPACQGNSPNDGDVVCSQALHACKRQDRTALLYFVFRGLSADALANVGTACLGDADFVDRRRLSGDVVAQLVRRLPLTAPAIRTAPGGSTLVRLPTVVWSVNPSTGVPDQPTYSVTGTVDDVSVTLTVHGSWTWDLADGSGRRTLAGPGVPYVRGASPDPRVDPAYYTHHGGGAATGLVTSYPSRGSYRLAVTVTWHPSYTVDYQVGTTDLDTAAVSYTTTAPLRVGEARAVLVAGTG